MVGPHITGKARFFQGFYNGRHIQRPVFRQMAAFFKAALRRPLHIAQVHKVDTPHGAVLFHHSGDIVLGRRPQGAGAERQTVTGAVVQGQKAVERRFIGDEPWQPENIPRRVVGVNRHVDATLFGYGDHFSEKIPQVFPQILFGNSGILLKKLF